MVPPLVLVVEDEFVVRINAVSLLEEAGFGVLEASSADDAIALLESRKDIRIVFTDINMPGSMDGLRLAHAIRNRWPPIELVLTSGQMRVRAEDMPERGLFLSKPYQPAELVRMVQSPCPAKQANASTLQGSSERPTLIGNRRRLSSTGF